MLRHNPSLYPRLLEVAPDAIVTVNRQGDIVFLNGQVEKIFGYVREELLGQPIEILVPERYREEHIGSRNGFMAQPRLRPMGAGLALTGRHKNGHEIPVEISLSPLDTEDGLLITAAIRDVTETRRMQMALEKSFIQLSIAQEELRQQNRELTAAKSMIEEGQKRYQELFDFAPIGYLVTDIECIIQDANQAAADMLGATKESLQGKRLKDFLDRHEQVDFESRFQAFQHGDGAVLRDWQTCLQPATAASFPASMAVSAIRTADGKWSGLRWQLSDITDRWRAEQEIKTRARRQEIIAELGCRALSGIDLYLLMDETAALAADVLLTPFCAVFECTSDGAALLLKAGAGWPSGLAGSAAIAFGDNGSENAALLAPVPVLFRSLDDEPSLAGVQWLRELGIASGLSVLIYSQQCPFGSLSVFAKEDRQFTASDVHFLQAAANVISIAIERKRNEQQQRERDLMRADQMAALGQVAAGMAHELRNPLTAIKGLIQVNREEADANGMPAEDLHVIDDEIRRLERTLQTFLDFARPRRLQRRPMPLEPLAEQVLSLINGRAGKQKVAIHYVRPSQPIVAEIDQDLILQLLLNLALNALDVMPGGGRLDVTLRLADNGQAEFQVQDTGPGIPANLLGKIFEPFVSSKETGMGLGLAVSRRIAEDHSGSLIASNRTDGSGAYFQLRVPAQTAMQ